MYSQKLSDGFNKWDLGMAVGLVQLKSKFTFNITIYTHYHINTYNFKKTSLCLLREDTFIVVRVY